MLAPQRHRSDERGQALVEFALVLPILLLVLFGIIQVGFILHAQHTVAYAARVAAETYARELSEGQATSDADSAATVLRPTLRRSATFSYDLVDQKDEKVCNRRAGGWVRRCIEYRTVSQRTETRASAREPGATGQLIKATIRYSYPLPIRGAFAGIQLPGALTLTGEALALIEAKPVAGQPEPLSERYPPVRHVTFEPAQGEDAAAHLARHGIQVSGVTPGAPLQVIDDRQLYGGQAARASSGHHVLSQVGSNGPVEFTLRFDPVRSVTFSRAMLIAGSRGITHPAWSAFAYDAAGRQVGAVHEGQINSLRNVPARSFTLTGSIASVRFVRSGYNGTAFHHALIDDLVLRR